MIRYFTLYTLLLTSTFGMGYSRPSWFNTDQIYLKLLIHETGWYRLEKQDLRKFQFPVKEDSLAYLQLFKHGQEIPIFLKKTTQDITIEFFGKKNDGTLEQVLYVPTTSPLHPDLSLYSDTTAYYLTYGQTIGKRVATVVDEIGAEGTWQSYYWRQESKQWTDEYTAGTIYPLGATYENGIILTDYEEGEGYCSRIITSENPITIYLPMSQRVDSIQDIHFTIRLVGRQAGKHAVILTNEEDSSKREIVVENFNSKDVSWNLQSIQDTVSIKLHVKGAVSLVYMHWTYAQSTAALATTTSHKMQLKEQETLQLDPDSLLKLYDLNTHELIKISRTSQVAGPRELWKIRTVNQVKVAKLIQFDTTLNDETDYLIISHASLLRNYKSDAQQPIRHYANYRSSPVGGGYRVTVMDIEQVYDQFNYGIRSPQAIRNMITTYATKGLKYVFLVGRSKDPQTARFTKNGWKDDLIPNAGWPGSDITLTMRSYQEPLPQVAIGRLFVSTVEEAAVYFAKVQQFESQPSAAPWRKNILHLSGGYSDAERTIFASYIDSFTAELEQSASQFKINTYYKQNNERQQKIDLSPEINRGVGLVTMFGHSSLTETDLDFGWATDTTSKYNNWGKYPAFWLNGCASGNMYFRNKTLSTDWITAVDKGAVLFVAHSHHGAVPGLKRYTDAFYHTLADKKYTNEPFGSIMKAAAVRYLTDFPWLTDLVTVQQMNLQGDPAIKIFPSQKPDLYIDSTTVEVITSNHDIYITLEIGNYGMAWQGDVEVALQIYNQYFSIYHTTENIMYDGKRKQVIRLSIPFSQLDNWTEVELRISLDPRGLLDEEDRENNHCISRFSSLTLKNEATIATYIKPNPVTDQAILCVNTPLFFKDFRVTLTIYNVLGNVILQSDQVVSSDYQEIEIALDRFPRGIYFYKVQRTNFRNGEPHYYDTGKLVLVR